MGFFKKMIDFFTLGSERPMRRLVAYYIVLTLVTVGLLYVFPISDRLFSGERLDELTGDSPLLQDGLSTTSNPVGRSWSVPPRFELAITTMLAILGTLALMLPVSWVYMSARNARRYNQSVVQTLLILPIVVSGIILVVRNSLALAFSLAGVVAAVRFRTTFSDARDVVFIFLAIAVGFAAGVQTFTVAALLSASFNFVLLFVWRYDFGRNVLEPTASAQWSEPLTDLAKRNGGTSVPDRDLVLALTPEKVDALADRFVRIRNLVGEGGKKPRYNAVLSVTTSQITAAQQRIEQTLERLAKRWKLDEVITHEGMPSEMYYLLRIKRSMPRDEIITQIRSHAGDLIGTVEVEVSEAVAKDQGDDA